MDGGDACMYVYICCVHSNPLYISLSIVGTSTSLVDQSVDPSDDRSTDEEREVENSNDIEAGDTHTYTQRTRKQTGVRVHSSAEHEDVRCATLRM